MDKSRFGCDSLSDEDGKEMVFTAYVRIEGKLTIPKEVRDALDIKRGDLVECRIRKIK